MLISVIVSTYNRPTALRNVLNGLACQIDKNFEVIIADDGSEEPTRQLVQSFQNSFPVPLHHAWQPDTGFRLSASRNNAVRLSHGKYFIFLDGDCIPMPTFIANHRKLAEEGWVVAGNRALISPELTRRLEAQNHTNPMKPYGFFQCLKWACHHDVNRVSPILALPLGLLRKISPQKWQRLRGCNIGVWRSDFMTVNGFDEDFMGWGFEDSDFAVRLINSGIKIKLGTFATGVLHMYHRETSNKKEGPSWETLQQRILSKDSYAPNGFKKGN